MQNLPSLRLRMEFDVETLGFILYLVPPQGRFFSPNLEFDLSPGRVDRV